MKKPFAWSYSALNSFETCPFRFKVTRVTKEVKEPEGEHLKWGNQVHSAFEDYINGKNLNPPEWFDPWKPIADEVKSRAASGWEVQAEREVCIDENMQPSSWWAKDVWCRGKIDVVLINRAQNLAVVLDWKTGKQKFVDDTQLNLFALLLMKHEPEITRVVASYVWLKDRALDRVVVDASDAPTLWAGILARVERMKRAYTEDKWAKNPSGLCRNWCPVPKHMCEHSGG